MHTGINQCSSILRSMRHTVGAVIDTLVIQKRLCMTLFYSPFCRIQTARLIGGAHGALLFYSLNLMRWFWQRSKQSHLQGIQVRLQLIHLETAVGEEIHFFPWSVVGIYSTMYERLRNKQRTRFDSHFRSLQDIY